MSLSPPFTKSLLQNKVYLTINEIGSNNEKNIERKIANKMEGKCSSDAGYIIPNSVQLVSYSVGKIEKEDIEHHVSFTCNVCLPIEGMEMKCVVKSITKPGIKAEYIHEYTNDENDVVKLPIITCYIVRDDNYENPEFEKVDTNMTILVRITGSSFELNDTSITTTADLISRG